MLYDVVVAFHAVRRNPRFTLLAILTMGLGIGAAAGVFSVAEAVLLRPLPYPEPDRLVDISHRTIGTPRLTVHRLDVVDLRRETKIFEDAAGRGMAVFDMTVRAGPDRAFHVSALAVTYNYFDVLGVEAALGRTFVLDDAQAAPPAEGEEPQAAAAVISHGLWQRALGGDPDLAERSLESPWGPLRVVGVLPPDFQLLHERLHRWVKGSGAEVFIPYPESRLNEASPRGGPGNRGFLALGRLKPGVTYEQAQAAMDLMAARLRAEHPEHEKERLRVEVYPLHQDLTTYTGRAILVVAGGVVFLLLLVCANVANLQLVRSRMRAGDDAVRAALGCGRRRLFGQKLGESLMLAIGGGVVGVALAWGTLRIVQALVPRILPLMNRLEMNQWTLLFGLGAAVVSMVLAGLLPAWQASRLDAASALSRGARRHTGEGRRLMGSLVVSELALSMVLLAGAATMVRTLVGMTRTDLGFEPEGVVSFELDLAGEAYRDEQVRATVYRRLEEELAAIPGVEAVARTDMVPLGDAVGNTTWGWNEDVHRQQTERADVVIATPGYLETMGARLLAGRLLKEGDANPTGDVMSAVVDSKAAGIAWPGEDPIGKEVIFWRRQQRAVVVGVVEHMLMRDFGMKSYEAIFIPEPSGWPGAAETFVLRTRPGAAGIDASIRRAVAAVDRSLHPYRIRRLPDRVSQSMGPARFVLFLMGFFAVVALVVAAVGLFGVIAYGVRARTAELGIRVALGASKGGILRMMLGRAGLLTLAGVAAGTVAALLLARFMTVVAYGVSPAEPLTLGGMALALALVSMAACAAPARWACNVDPVRALRET